MTLKSTLEGFGPMLNDSSMSATIQNDPKIIQIGPFVFYLDYCCENLLLTALSAAIFNFKKCSKLISIYQLVDVEGTYWAS